MTAIPCLLCFQLTDSGLVMTFESEIEHAAWLVLHGRTMPDARELAATQPWVGGREHTVYYRICGQCAARIGLPEPTPYRAGAVVTAIAIKSRN